MRTYSVHMKSVNFSFYFIQRIRKKVRFWQSFDVKAWTLRLLDMEYHSCFTWSTCSKVSVCSNTIIICIGNISIWCDPIIWNGKSLYTCTLVIKLYEYMTSLYKEIKSFYEQVRSLYEGAKSSYALVKSFQIVLVFICLFG